jgi:phosphoglucosamine mutase
LGAWFGTDGIRDLAGQGRLAPDALARIGRALVRFAASDGRAPRVAIARDPRPSGSGLVATLAAHMSAEGAEVVAGGVLPTPAVAWWTAAEGFDLGVAVSASHNPPDYNGVKPFARGGRKLTEAEEADVEARIEAARPLAAEGEAGLDPAVGWRYADAAARGLAAGGRLDGVHLVVDLAAGAATTTAPAVLRALGAIVTPLHPASSRAINDACGSEHPGSLRRALLAQPGALGLAFDGDADRMLLFDEERVELDGDDALAALATAARHVGAPVGDLVVSTVMANGGLESYLRDLGMELVRTPVGDRHVAQAMRAREAVLGGEPSGHLVLPHPGAPDALVGDGVVAAVRVLQAARALGRPLTDVRALWTRWPQRLENVRLPVRRDLESWDAFRRAMAVEERDLAGRGRLVVRWSGTEPLLRIMVEAREAALVDRAVDALARAARETVSEA